MALGLVLRKLQSALVRRGKLNETRERSMERKGREGKGEGSASVGCNPGYCVLMSGYLGR